MVYYFQVINMKKDTITAIATALGESALNIVRISGDDAFLIVDKVFTGKSLSTAKSHTIHYGKISYKNQVIDEVLVNVFKAPKTFTAENLVEINCHGGPYIANKILSALLASGA